MKTALSTIADPSPLSGLQGATPTGGKGVTLFPSDNLLSDGWIVDTPAVTGSDSLLSNPVTVDSHTVEQKTRTPSDSLFPLLPSDLSRNQLMTLIIIVRGLRSGRKVMSRRYISKGINKTPPTVRFIVSELRRKGYITTETYRDGIQQGYIFCLTDKTSQLLQRLAPLTDHLLSHGRIADYPTNSSGCIKNNYNNLSDSELSDRRTAPPIEHEVFDQLDRTDWPDLCHNALAGLLNRPLDKLQFLMDQAAHVVRSRCSTEKPILQPINFLRAVLRQGFCEVDNTFKSREILAAEKLQAHIRHQREKLDQIKKQTEEEVVALMRAQLNASDLAVVEEEAEANCRRDYGSATNKMVVEIEQRRLLVAKATERGIYQS